MNKFISKEELKKILMEEPFKRTTISFYRYVRISDPEGMRERLLKDWEDLNVFGRIYVAREGINAQLSFPEDNFDEFRANVDSYSEFKDIPFKIAVDDDGKSFYKLCIKVREKIVADGLSEEDYDVTNVGSHLDAEKFNEALEEGAIVIDMRNQYESEVGHFEGAICPDADTFREELPMVAEELKGKEKEKVLLYCTGGIRCEKASAFLKEKGFEDVNQLHGGIIAYKHQVEEKGLPCKFVGKNFVFDERMGERITDDVIAECHQCGKPCDDHTNCKNDDCHLLFIQCDECAEKFEGCCTPDCQKIAALPEEEQRRIRRDRKKTDCLSVYKSRLRPNLKDLIRKD